MLVVVVAPVTHAGPVKQLPPLFGRCGEEAVVVECRVAAEHCLGYNAEENVGQEAG